MHISRAKWKSSNGKSYESIYLRESYREDGKVKKRQVANLTHCPPEEVAAIELALKHKNNLSELSSLQDVHLEEGLSVGAVWTLYETARRIGIEKALGKGRAGKLALWQVIARVLEQGSRLSATRLARIHAACDVLGIEGGFDENDLYENLTWLNEHQASIEQKLFESRRGQKKPNLFLYDVTSSYLEGEKNELAAYGYNRDRKKGKKQIVIGLLCDETGAPVSTEVFRGNTQDAATFASQVEKIAERFGCEHVTLVGDRGMIKRAQIEELSETNFHYITAITKPQIRTLLKSGVLQMTLFDKSICEVEHEGVRYILRRNPLRAEQLKATRAEKLESVQTFVERQNHYLAEHPRGKVEVAVRKVEERVERLKIMSWLSVQIKDRFLSLKIDEAAFEESAQLDGCYVLKSDVPKSVADAETLHARYKDLAEVEQAFRACKTAHLEVRPVYVRKEANTRGHVLVVMLAYLLRRELSQAWAEQDVTVEEGLEQLKTICSLQMKVKGGGSCLTLPKPRPSSVLLLEALKVTLPEALPQTGARVVTRTPLQKHRKTYS